jgi:predicted kinase
VALERLQAIRIRSDVERKRLFGLAPLADSSTLAEPIYTAHTTQQTYARLHGLARELLAAGIAVIVDAAFLRWHERELFRGLAHELAVPFAIASLQVSTTGLKARIIRRRNESKDASEADIAVLKSLQEQQEILTAAEKAHTVEFFNEGKEFAVDAHAWEKIDRLISR